MNTQETYVLLGTVGHTSCLLVRGVYPTSDEAHQAAATMTHYQVVPVPADGAWGDVPVTYDAPFARALSRCPN